MSTMLILPTQPPIYQDVDSLPLNANDGAVAVVLTSPPELFLFDGTNWNEVVGGIFIVPSNAPANQFCNGVDSGGNLLYTQPSFSNISGVATVVQGGTGQSTYTNGQLLIGNTATNSLTKATITAGSGINITNGNGSITIALSGAGLVSSIAGTTNQITASASTGAVTLSFPNGLSVGSYQATTPPTGGMIMPGNLGLGTTTVSDKLHLSVGNIEGIRIESTNCGALKYYTTSADSNSRNWMIAQNWTVAGDFCFVRSSAAGVPLPQLQQ